MMAHTFNPSYQETEAGSSLWIQVQPGLHSEFLASKSYLVRPWLNKQASKGVKEITQWLRTLVALAEKPGSTPSNSNFSSRGCDT